jgi:hypothetical protein
MKASAIRQMAINTHTHAEFSIQKNGLRSKSRSLKVPPPNAANPETIIIPTRSSFFLAASISPDSAKASIPITSNNAVPLISSQPVKSNNAQSESLPLEMLAMLRSGWN